MAVMKINELEIRKAIALLKPDGQLFEIRYIGESGRLNFSGYFTDADVLIDKLNHLAPTESGNVYITLNAINEACYSRQQHNKFVKNCKNTTSDNDIVGYTWLMIDLDPKRPSGTSSSEAELNKAHDVAERVFKYLTGRGWEKPIVAMSGNGYHLLYKIHAANNPERSRLIENALKALDMLFGDEKTVDVDTMVFNPSRICKLYGTEAVKGADTKDRPHRMAKIVYAPDEIKTNDIELLEELADELPEEPERPQSYNNYNPKRFDLEEWFKEHNVEITQVSAFKDGKKYILKECPFDSNHKGKDACIIQLSNGAICFHCFHQSCSRYTWKDFREHYEPTVYTKKEYHKPNRELPMVPERESESTEVDVIEPTKVKPIFYTANDISNIEAPPEEFIKTGVEVLDKKLRGLKKGFVTCLSGLRASGKSSIISQLAIEAAEQDYRTALYSGELTPKNLLKWLVLQAAGKENVTQTNFANYFMPLPGIERQVCDWLDDRLLVYNNDYGNDYEFIENSLERCIEEYKVDLIILDNLMTLDIQDLDRDIFRAQSKFVRNLEVFAKLHNVHILFVAHPRKSQGFLRLDDISGSNDIVNQVDNALILHRVNEDFKRLSKETLKWSDADPIYQATNVIEICKDRDGGVQDEFIPLYFEAETKRLRNSTTENKIYGNGGFEVEQDLPF